jgi:diguanylate cyclase (GGDEF)-like protein
VHGDDGPLLGDVLDGVPAIVYADEGRRVTYVSARAAEILGRPGRELLEDPAAWAAAIHPDDSGGDGRRGGEYRLLRADGTAVWAHDVPSHDGAGVILVLAEPTVRDAATGLPGEALLREHVALAVARAREQERQVVVLRATLDGLDLVADGLGPRVAERALREVAGRMREALRESDLVAAPRHGELAVVLADLRGDGETIAETVAGEVLATVRRPLSIEGHELELGAHVGASCHPTDADDAEDLLRHAGAAMRQSRGSGDSALVFYAGGTTEALERLLIGARLRRALDEGRLRLHYQPIFRLPEGDVMGVEALLRWEDPRRGTIPPLEFIPVAEYTGLIEPIGRWVVGELCAQARAWADEGFDLSASFNVSLRQFRDPALVPAIRDALERTGLDGSRLIVEITESTAMRDPSCVEPVLEELRALGVRLAIDDFGTGHSSLARLREMPVDVLKIDRGFLLGAPADASAARLVHATLELVRALDLVAVAEGVETEDQRRFLSDGGCPLAQGFHLARPMPADEATALLHAQRPV